VNAVPFPDIFSEDFTQQPLWWDDFEPAHEHVGSLPKSVDVVIVGGGYTGLSCALTLRKAGVSVIVLEAGRFGEGASTRSGGQVSGGVNIQKKAIAGPSQSNDTGNVGRQAVRLREAGTAMGWFEEQIDQRRIECDYHRTGRLTAIYAPQHYESWQNRLASLNELTNADASMLSRDQLVSELGTAFYHGAALIRRAGHLQPARLFGGLLEAARRENTMLASGCPAQAVLKGRNGHIVRTAQGDICAEHVVIATNGYPSAAMGKLRGGVVAVTSHVIATEELPQDLAATLVKKDRAVSESRRVVNYYRLSPNGRRLVFGGRARFIPTEGRKTAQILFRMMVERFPQLADVRVSHSWGGNVGITLDRMPAIGSDGNLHWAFGCNGSGIVMMNWLGHKTAEKILHGRDAELSAFENNRPARHPFHAGNGLFLFAAGSYMQLRDRLERAWARK
jgi:glycine/D-amino acid oxidase-like deaminating enzyme